MPTSSHEYESGEELAPQNLILPEYVPFQKVLTRDFESVSVFQNYASKSIKELIGQISVETLKYLDYIIANPHLHVDESFFAERLEALSSLLRSEEEIKLYKSSISESKQSIKDHILRDHQLNVDTLGELQSVYLSNFADQISSEYVEYRGMFFDEDQFRRILHSNSLYSYIKKSSFVVQNPEDPIPEDEEENDEDEELNVSGGKISLKDPLSLNYFEDPVSSSKCKHTYDKDTITLHLNSGHSECPIDGCSRSLSTADLKEDKIMLLRVKVFKSREKRARKENETTERIS
ncbi:zinc-finger of the MIZ type in Nse subunit-domain-containing protein [Scheffersomyces xylosifermentans]|uniref:zinc-finger of the MIZ type in Nse subunit-domain-containing protein n=1 Tax=Scheffersomyces xylosifermentans TaxID=1304137 RepID=UPI00315DFB97